MSGSNVTFASAAGDASGFLARPARSKRGLIVLQEWWGLVPHIERVATRLTELGYTALAPDLYHGKSTVEEAEAAHLMQGLDWGKAAKEISGAIRHLREAEDCTTIGVVGFCMGGALTLISALDPAVDAYVAYYGFPPAGSAPVEKIAAPGLIFFGEDESYFSVPDAQAFAKAQTGRGRPTEVVIYPGAGHGFFNDDRPAVFRKDAANDAWRRTLEHFGRYLR